MLLKNSPRLKRLNSLPWRALTRWFAVGVSFYFVGLLTLYVLIGLMKVSLLWGTLLSAEATTIIRYVINDLWVFENRSLSWTRLSQYHVANAGGFAVWWIIVNALPHFGVHYLIASTAGTATSMCSTLLTNFLWIWRKARRADVLADGISSGILQAAATPASAMKTPTARVIKAGSVAGE